MLARIKAICTPNNRNVGKNGDMFIFSAIKFCATAKQTFGPTV
jgi:hypothetical protein